MPKYEIGLVGLGVMGGNLVLNLANKGFKVAVFNRTPSKTKEFMGRIVDVEIFPAYSLNEFTDSLEVPRKIILMITAGEATDSIIAGLTSNLSVGDVILDGGNAFYGNTERREKELIKKGILYTGLGISGGEEGALNGPCIMSGGSTEAYKLVSPILTKIAARGNHGVSCAHVGSGGAGHFVKMVHNGIEYALLQLISEVHDVLSTGMGFDIDKICSIYKEWNKGDLGSYLMEIAARSLERYDDETGKPLVDVILDRAGQKGTGKWTSQSAMDLGIPTPTIDAAVSARNLSGLKDQRVIASRLLGANSPRLGEDLVEQCKNSLYCSFIVSFAQGLALLQDASKKHQYHTNLRNVAHIWKGGCIIRSKLLDRIQEAFEKENELPNLLLDNWFASKLNNLDGDWRSTIQKIKEIAIPCPALSNSLDYYDGYRRDRLSANMIQVMRDVFGSHGYERVDKKGHFHTEWRM